MTASANQCENPLAEMIRLTVQLHELMRQEQDDERGDALRDEMDIYWKKLSNTEREISAAVSADLYTLEDDNVIRHPLEPRVFSKELEHDLSLARSQGDWLGALKLLRERAQEISADQAAALRAFCYEHLNHPEVALIFSQRAASLERSDGSFSAMCAKRLVDAHRIAEAVSIVDRMESQLPAISWKALALISLTFSRAAMNADHSDALILIERTFLALKRWENEPTLSVDIEIARDKCQTAYVFLSIAYYMHGYLNEAIETLSNAIDIESNDPYLHALRGVWHLEGGAHNAAKADFEVAVSRGISDDAPYIFLAHDALIAKNYSRCIELCRHALRLGTNLKADVYGFLAVAMHHLGYPVEDIENCLNKSLASDPANLRIQQNVARLRTVLAGHAESPGYWQEQSGLGIDLPGTAERISEQVLSPVTV